MDRIRYPRKRSVSAGSTKWRPKNRSIPEHAAAAASASLDAAAASASIDGPEGQSKDAATMTEDKGSGDVQPSEWLNDAGPIPDKGTVSDLSKPVHAVVCPKCNTVVKGGRWSLRQHQLTSSKCMYASGSVPKAREPCSQCGKPLAAGDAWAREQHAKFCSASSYHRARSNSRSRPATSSQTRWPDASDEPSSGWQDYKPMPTSSDSHRSWSWHDWKQMSGSQQEGQEEASKQQQPLPPSSAAATEPDERLSEPSGWWRSSQWQDHHDQDQAWGRHSWWTWSYSSW